jgi:hypothetical protein
MNFVRLVNHRVLPDTACRSYLCDSTGYLTSSEIYTLRTEFTEYELRAYLQRRNNWSDKVYDSISWPAYRSASTKLSDNERTFVVKLTHGWLPIGVRERRCSGTTDNARNAANRDSPLYRCQSRAQWRNRFVIHLHGHLKDTKTAADLRRTIIQGIESWFITGRMILTAVRSPSKSVGFKSLKDTYQKIGHQCEYRSEESQTVLHKTAQRVP